MSGWTWKNVSYLAALALLLVASYGPGTRRAIAEEPVPVAVFSIASFDRLIGDLLYLTEATGAGDVGRFVALMASPYTSTMDKAKPAGAYLLMPEGQQAVAVIFLPVKDLKSLLKTLEPQVGQPEDVGDGLLAVATDRAQPVYLKQAGDWVFVSNDKQQLAAPPENPIRLLRPLQNQYTLAFRLEVAKLPPDVKAQAIDQMQKGFEEQLAERMEEEDTDESRAMREASMKSMIDLIDGAETLSFGWRADAEQESTHLDIAVTAVPGTPLAQQLANVKEAASRFAGFQLDGEAVSFHAHGTSTPAEIRQSIALLGKLREQAMQKLDKDERLQDDGERGQVKQLIGRLLDIAVATVEAGELDFGGSVLLSTESLRGVAGVSLADGAELAATLQELAPIAEKKLDDFPRVRFAAETHRGVTLHTASLPVKSDNPDLRKLLGESFDVVLGTGPKAAYVAFGREAAATLKRCLDESAGQESRRLPPGQLTVVARPILESAAAMNSDARLDSARDVIQQGNDRATLQVTPIDRGVRMRLEVQGGILKAVGAAAKAPTAAAVVRP